MGPIATIGFYASLIGFVYAIYYCMKPTAGMSEAYKARKKRGEKKALLWIIVGFPVVGSFFLAIIKAVY